MMTSEFTRCRVVKHLRATSFPDTSCKGHARQPIFGAELDGVDWFEPRGRLNLTIWRRPHGAVPSSPAARAVPAAECRWTSRGHRNVAFLEIATSAAELWRGHPMFRVNVDTCTRWRGRLPRPRTSAPRQYVHAVAIARCDQTLLWRRPPSEAAPRAPPQTWAQTCPHRTLGSHARGLQRGEGGVAMAAPGGSRCNSDWRSWKSPSA